MRNYRYGASFITSAIKTITQTRIMPHLPTLFAFCVFELLLSFFIFCPSVDFFPLALFFAHALALLVCFASSCAIACISSFVSVILLSAIAARPPLSSPAFASVLYIFSVSSCKVPAILITHRINITPVIVHIF